MAALYRRVTLCKQKPFEVSQRMREKRKDESQGQLREHDLQNDDKKERDIKKCVCYSEKELDNERNKNEANRRTPGGD